MSSLSITSVGDLFSIVSFLVPDQCAIFLFSVIWDVIYDNDHPVGQFTYMYRPVSHRKFKTTNFFWRQAVKQKGLKQTGILTRAGHSDFAHAFRFMAIDYRISKWNCIEKLNTVYSLSGCAIMRKN